MEPLWQQIFGNLVGQDHQGRRAANSPMPPDGQSCACEIGNPTWGRKYSQATASLKRAPLANRSPLELATTCASCLEPTYHMGMLHSSMQGMISAYLLCPGAVRGWRLCYSIDVKSDSDAEFFLHSAGLQASDPYPVHDGLIAATALLHGVTVVPPTPQTSHQQAYRCSTP